MKIMMISKTLMLILPILISVAFITLAERKVLSLTGSRQGPNKVSFQGILQPMADAMKLANKSTNSLSNFSLFMYYISVMVMFLMTMMLWSNTMADSTMINWKMSFLVLMLILGISSMKAIMAGWSTYSKYSLIGSMRTVSQMISYESVIYLTLLVLIWLLKSFSMMELKIQEMVFMLLMAPMICYFWLPSVLAELNRTPYDFSEGESELVSGFNTEFGSKSFTLIFLSEYSNIIFFMLLTITLFMSQNLNFITLAYFSFMNFWIIWIRSTLPRLRFDKFMSKAWKFYIPFMTLMLMVMIAEI